MQKILKQVFLLICITLVLTLPYFVFANPAITGLDNVRKPSGFAETNEFTLSKTIGTFINTLFSLLGVIFIGLIIYGGYNWMTAAGDTGKLDIAKNTFRRAIIGLIITIGSYAIWFFVYDKFITG